MARFTGSFTKLPRKPDTPPCEEPGCTRPAHTIRINTRGGRRQAWTGEMYLCDEHDHYGGDLADGETAEYPMCDSPR